MTDMHARNPGEVSRRERKKDETRERIAQVALALFLERGFAATTVDEIAQRADVAKGTFFNHFPRKESVLTHFATADVDRLEELVDDALAANLPMRQALADVFRRSGEPYERTPELSRVLFLEMMKGPDDALFEIHTRAHTAVRRLVDRAQSRGELRAAADPDRATELLRGVFISTTLVWLHAPDVFELRSEIRARLTLLIDGLSAEGAR